MRFFDLFSGIGNSVPVPIIRLIAEKLREGEGEGEEIKP